MNITVCDLLSNRLTVSVGVDDTLDVLRQRIADETGLYISKFDMIVGDKDLTDVQQLSADEEVVLVRRDGWVQTEHFANRAANVIREKFRMEDGGVFTVHFCTPNNGKASLDHVEESCFVGAGVEAVVHRAYAAGRKAQIVREPQAVYIEGGFPHGGENFRDIHAPWGTILPNRVQRGPLSWDGHIILECGHVGRGPQTKGTRHTAYDDTMNITVCDLLSNRLTVSVGVDDTLDVLRQRIADETGLYISKFDMIVGDKDLTDVQQLSADEEVVLVRRDGWVQTEHFANRAANVIREKFRMEDGGASSSVGMWIVRLRSRRMQTVHP
eukprot:TRINITY_DN5094_c0_g1_i4.p1 TRINITY_DN5094_c0_g1~~TRINITY_DN5094_c0_g1_i4.p1  ORF type:complete len:378 (+),score=135.48 TRINITY_DN5094_c0_g1_i4:158-1135(+)